MGFSAYFVFVLFTLVCSQDPIVLMSQNTQSGQATYYGGSVNAGACSINPVPAFVQTMFNAGTLMPAALNAAQYASGDQSKACGLCLVLNETGTGSGANPVRGPMLVWIKDVCPECPVADIDLSTSGDGRWGIVWRAVNCPVGSEKLSYIFQGSHTYYLKMQVRGHTVPVLSVEYQTPGGAWIAGVRTSDNFYTCPSYPYPVTLPLNIRVTSVTNEVVLDSVPAITANLVTQTGTNQVQFVGFSGGTPPATPAPVAATKAPTASAPTKAPTSSTSAPTLNPTNTPTPFPTANPTATPTAFPTPAPTSPTQAPTQYPVGTPTIPPSNAPSLSPSAAPTPFPTQSPTGAPTPFPTPGPTAVPTEFPTSGPTPAPTPFPTQAPTNPTQAPTNPTSEPSAAPSFESAPIEPTTVLTNAPTEAPVTGNTCWDLDVMSRVFNSDIARIQTLWNSDAKMVQAGLYVAFIAPSTVSNNHLTSRVDINLASLTDQEVATLCDAIRRELDADFGSASSCWKYSCWAAKKRQLGTTSVNFDLSPPDSSFPVWIVVVAVIGGLILLALIIVAVVLFMKKQKKSSSEWEKY